MGAAKKIAIYTILLSSFAFLIAVVKFTKNCTCITSHVFKGFTLDINSDQSKWNFLSLIGMQLAVFLFAHTILVMTLRILTSKSSPSTQEDSTFIKVLNRVIYNSLEQSFIFILLLGYFLFNGPVEKFEPTFVLNIGAWFIAGRILFTVGYLLGTAVGLPQLRAYGFAMTFFCNMFLVEQILCSKAYVTSLPLQL